MGQPYYPVVETFRGSPDHSEALQALARRDGASKSEIMRRLILKEARRHQLWPGDRKRMKVGEHDG